MPSYNKRHPFTPIAVLIASAIMASVFAGCGAHAYSPPARIATVETARTLEEGETSHQLAGGLFSEVLGAEGGLVSVRVRHGVSDALELGGDVTLIHITSEGAGDPHPNIYEGRAALRWGPEWAGDYVALTAGLGGGASAAGGFVSPDIGLNIAYENRYVVPFLTGSLLVSVPVGAKAVDLSDFDSEPGTDMQTPVTTKGAVLGAGISIPVHFGTSEDLHKGSIGLSVSWTWLDDGEESASIQSIAPAIEIVF